MGFCLGGTLAWGVASAADPAVCISYYGSGVPGMLGMIDQVQCPTLFHFGNQDAYIPNEGVDAIGAAIAGRDGFVLNVENAGHAFDNHESEIFYNEAASKAAGEDHGLPGPAPPRLSAEPRAEPDPPPSRRLCQECRREQPGQRPTACT